MENCKTKRCRTRPPLVVIVAEKPNIKNMPKRDYNIFIGELAEIIQDEIVNPTFIMKEENDCD